MYWRDEEIVHASGKLRIARQELRRYLRETGEFCPRFLCVMPKYVNRLPGQTTCERNPS